MKIPLVLNCRHCGDCCGPVVVSEAERRSIGAWCRQHDIRGHDDHGQDCRYLSRGEKRECMIYPVRPRLCRLFAAVEDSLHCEHGARAEHPLNAAQATDSLPSGKPKLL